MWEPKSANCCQLHPAKTLGLRWICLNLLQKVTFPRKSKRHFKLRKSNNTEQPSVARSIREKGKGCTNHLPLFTVSLQGEPWVSCFISESSQISQVVAYSAQVLSPGWFWPPHQRTEVSEAHHVFPPSLLPSLLLAPGLLPCAPQEGAAIPFLAHGFPHLLLWKNQPLKEGERKEIQFFKNAFLIGGLNYWINRLQCRL